MACRHSRVGPLARAGQLRNPGQSSPRGRHRAERLHRDRELGGHPGRRRPHPPLAGRGHRSPWQRRGDNRWVADGLRWRTRRRELRTVPTRNERQLGLLRPGHRLSLRITHPGVEHAAFRLRHHGLDEVEPGRRTRKARRATTSSHTRTVYACRSLRSVWPAADALSRTPALLGAVADALACPVEPVLWLFFDKHPSARWVVPWHRDVSVREPGSEGTRRCSERSRPGSISTTPTPETARSRSCPDRIGARTCRALPRQLPSPAPARVLTPRPATSCC